MFARTVKKTLVYARISTNPKKDYPRIERLVEEVDAEGLGILLQEWNGEGEAR